MGSLLPQAEERIRKLLARIDATNLAEGYVPAQHQQYGERRMARLTEAQRALVARSRKAKQRIEPDTLDRGLCFVKILEFVADGEPSLVKGEGVPAQPSLVASNARS